MKIEDEVVELEREVYDYSLFLLVALLLVLVFGFAYYVIVDSRSFVRKARRSAFGRSRKA